MHASHARGTKALCWTVALPSLSYDDLLRRASWSDLDDECQPGRPTHAKYVESCRSRFSATNPIALAVEGLRHFVATLEECAQPDIPVSVPLHFEISVAGSEARLTLASAGYRVADAEALADARVALDARFAPAAVAEEIRDAAANHFLIDAFFRSTSSIAQAA